MKVHNLIDELLDLQDAGYGDCEVCYMYQEPDGTMTATVRGTIVHIEVADPADGKEVHMWN